MSWRVEVMHRSVYTYAGEVVASFNEARMTPLTNQRQRTLASRLLVAPSASTYRYVDYWGTIVDAFDVHVPHDRMVLTSTALVETAPPDSPRSALRWQDLTADTVRDRFHEYLMPTRHVALDRAAIERAEAVVEQAGGDAGTPAATARALVDWVRSTLRYERGVTQVSATSADVLAIGAGVCQDFAHVVLALARAVGIPARYVSGYLHPDPDAELGWRTAGENHAWVELWLGEWRGIDPVSGSAVGERHVLVARGRDYADVSPLRGVYQGAPSSGLSVEVELVRVS